MATAIGGGAVEVSLGTIIKESQRIISAHSRHFLALTLMFLLLPCFSLSFLPSLIFSSSSSSSPLHRIHPLNSHTFIALDHNDPTALGDAALLVSLFALFLLVFSLLSTASITRSVLHGFYGRPVRLLPAALSAFSSFLPLLLTSALYLSLLLAFLLLSLSSLYLLLRLVLLLLGLSPPPYVMLPLAALSLAVPFVFVRLKLNWQLSPVVAVVESTWGFQPLKRSRFLLDALRPAALSIFLFFKFLSGLLLVAAASSALFLSSGSEEWRSWVYVVEIVVTCASLMVLFLYEAAANTVLYMYCKAARGELAWEIAEEFSGDYVSLPFDGHKVPHVVSVVYSATAAACT